MKFRKAVWRDCFQAHWDSAHRDTPMPAATAALLQLTNDEAEWCDVVIARGGKANTTMRKRAAAISQAEGGGENRKKRAPQEESKAAANEGA